MRSVTSACQCQYSTNPCEDARAFCMFGFMGAVARYTAAEQVPVATDAVSDLAEGTQGAVKTVARAVTEGVREGLTDERQ